MDIKDFKLVCEMASLEVNDFIIKYRGFDNRYCMIVETFNKFKVMLGLDAIIPTYNNVIVTFYYDDFMNSLYFTHIETK